MNRYSRQQLDTIDIFSVRFRLDLHKTVDPLKGCWKTSHWKSGHPNGYKRMRIGPASHRLNPYIHHMALLAYGRITDLYDLADNHGLQASHLCHESDCFNPDHIVIESSQSNKRRNDCKASWKLLYEGGCYNPCPHTVQCILEPRSLPLRPIS